jgi:hypothetical protein
VRASRHTLFGPRAVVLGSLGALKVIAILGLAFLPLANHEQNQQGCQIAGPL